LSKIKITEKFEPFFEVIAGKHPQVTRVIITGGRESGKTFTSGLGFCQAIVEFNHRILYTRYTLTSAEKSIIPAMENRAELLGLDPWLNTVGKTISTTHNRGKIDFAGFKTSSGNQTAALKSLEDYSVLVCEEAEEYPSFEEWEKVELSIRAKDVAPFSVMILNPTAKTHWIYPKFFTARGVKDGHNGIVGDTLYIHVTYLDLGEEFVAPKNWILFESARKIWNKVQRQKKADEPVESKDEKVAKWFSEVVLGGWKSSVDGILIPDWDLFDDWPHDVGKDGKKTYHEPTIRIFGLDWGFNPDPTALVEMRKYGQHMYVKQHICETNLVNSEIIERIKKIVPDDCYIVADSAEPKTIEEFKRAGLAIIKAKKPPGSIKAGIKKINNCILHVHRDSDDIQHELNHYHSIIVVNTKGETVIHIVDKDNHTIDSIRYADSLY